MWCTTDTLNELKIKQRVQDLCVFSQYVIKIMGLKYVVYKTYIKSAYNERNTAIF